MSNRDRAWWSSLLSLINATLTQDRTGLCLIGSSNAGSSAAPGSSIDAALRRRFGRTLVLGPPTANDLAQVVSFHVRGALSAADVLPVVRLAPGASAADGANWARDAMNAARDAGRAVTVADVLAVAAPPDRRPADAVRRVAFHEAAHAIVGRAVGQRVAYVTIVETGGFDGGTRMVCDREALTAETVDMDVMVGLAGRAAEEVILGAPSAGAEGDLAAATALLAAAHGSVGLGAWLVHRAPSAEAAALLAVDADLRDLVEAHMAALYAETLALVRVHRGAIERVADALVQRRMLTGDEVAALAGASATGRAP